ncbi:cupin domain-containing protein [Nevskia ramosa]|uniref:cupin domain-containing protein n=1 Tax=Nevskia ramosa TaxID=64002 RepID=UPI0003B6B673|nr:cupin domain-containing protein [Nevskia ramosa]
MKLNTDYTQRVVIDTTAMDWTPSPEAGVERKRLDRDGDEVARATSLVRYAPGSRFAAHTHGGGEEFYVLEGVFEDEHAAYPAGTYVRNPKGSRHIPRSSQGCTILVKLWQFENGDTAQFAIDTSTVEWKPGRVPCQQEILLHQFGDEVVKLIDFAPGCASLFHAHGGGEEVLVLQGVLSDELGDYPAGTWYRVPPGSAHTPFSRAGCRIWFKAGHLPPRTKLPGVA